MDVNNMIMGEQCFYRDVEDFCHGFEIMKLGGHAQNPRFVPNDVRNGKILRALYIHFNENALRLCRWQRFDDFVDGNLVTAGRSGNPFPNVGTKQTEKHEIVRGVDGVQPVLFAFAPIKHEEVRYSSWQCLPHVLQEHGDTDRVIDTD